MVATVVVARLPVSPSLVAAGDVASVMRAIGRVHRGLGSIAAKARHAISSCASVVLPVGRDLRRVANVAEAVGLQARPVVLVAEAVGRLAVTGCRSIARLAAMALRAGYVFGAVLSATLCRTLTVL